MIQTTLLAQGTAQAVCTSCGWRTGPMTRASLALAAQRHIDYGCRRAALQVY